MCFQIAAKYFSVECATDLATIASENSETGKVEA